jgi:hypothetical protein
MQIKVGFLVSYDYEYLKISLPLVYNDAELIALAIDKNRRTWNGESFELKVDFFEWIKNIDTQNKIRIYEDDFFIPSLSAIENDTRERNMLAAFMGEGGWHIQIDSDEYFLDFPAFVKYLRTQDHYLIDPAKNRVDICTFLVVLYKKTEHGYLYIRGQYELCFTATNFPDYKKARTGINKRKFIPYLQFHQTWARSEEEIRMKFRNWGHNIDFDTSEYFQMWQQADETNYHTFQNLHPLHPPQWRSLGWIEGKTMDDVIDEFKKTSILKVPKRVLIKHWLKEIKRKITS